MPSTSVGTARWPLLFLVLFALALVPGCGGCRDDEGSDELTEEELIEKNKRPEEDFEVGNLRVEPSDDSLQQYRVKPGHYASVTLPVKANNFAFQGELYGAAVDRDNMMLPIEDTPFSMAFIRKAPLAKGQEKPLEALYYVPNLGPDNTVFLLSRLRSARGGREVAVRTQPVSRMPDYQYFWVVLTPSPTDYAYLNELDTVQPPFDDLAPELAIVYYHVRYPPSSRGVTLPSLAFCWTSTAIVLWDGEDPNRLTPDQQTAMLDWLHWGGQLLISGPNSLDTLQGSFLEPYLPASKVEATGLGPEDFAELNEHWSLREQESQVLRSLDLLEDEPMVGVAVSAHPEAAPLTGTGELVWERRVGRGRVVLTTFSLAERRIQNWGSFDSFVNGGLLRRPPRRFEADETTVIHALWDGIYRGQEAEPRFQTNLRFFSRDVEHRLSDQMASPGSWWYSGYQSMPEAGVGGWNDQSGTAQEARIALRDAAGITIPRADFVLRVLAVYLLILVPVNWAIFRVVGRVEWAWIAAPLVAVAGAVVVVRTAQLDIGFVRARTQVGVLEMHADYPRGHLTRYAALYTSLSTGYDFAFDSAHAVAQPFATGQDMAYQGRVTPFTINGQRVLRDVQVDSNTTGMVHAEEFFDAGGSFTLQGDENLGYQVTNGTNLAVQSAGVVRRASDGTLEAAWLGDLAAGQTKPLNFRLPLDEPLPDESLAVDPERAYGGSSLWFPEWQRTESNRVSVYGIMRLALYQLHLHPGEIRLLGWVDEPFEGLEIRPRASQENLRTMLLVHLGLSEFPDAEPDANLWADANAAIDDFDF